MKKTAFLLPLVLVALGACSRDRDNNPVANVKEAVKDMALQNKTFESECNNKPLMAAATWLTSGEAVSHARTQYRVDGNNITLSSVLFARPDCTGAPAWTFRELGTIEIDENKKSADGGTFVDLHYKTVKVKMGDQAAADIANKVKLCSVVDWAPDQERDVTNTSKDLTCYTTQVPRDIQTIYKINGNIFYLGNDSILTTKDKTTSRPTSLDMSTKYFQTGTTPH